MSPIALHNNGFCRPRLVLALIGGYWWGKIVQLEPRGPAMAQIDIKKRGKAKPGANTGLTQEELLRGYRDMMLIRRFEEKAGQLYGLGLLRGWRQLHIGPG